jgi:cell division protein FtsQ
MKLFSRFMTGLGDKSRTVSEVDLSNPEDVKALIPDQAGAAAGDVLVHFGSEDFLHRYDLYQKNLSGWRKEFPHLASADMRYDRQVVLEMQPGSAVPLNESALPKAEDGPAPGVAHRPAAKLVKVAKAAAKPAPRPVVAHKVVPGQHLTQAFDVPRKAVKPQKPGVTR